jgi:hypothetical protein
VEFCQWHNRAVNLRSKRTDSVMGTRGGRPPPSESSMTGVNQQESMIFFHRLTNVDNKPD